MIDLKKLNELDVYSLLLYSFRYVLGRRSMSPSHWVEIYRTLFPQLPEEWKNKLNIRLKEELKEAIDYDEQIPGWLGDECDAKMWIRFYFDLMEEKKK